jgi:hypothetical protein
MGATYDGGETTDQVDWAGDNHDMWADPKDPNRMMIGSDIGVVISTTRGKKWNWTRLPIAQMYHVAIDNRIPYNVYGQMQDGGSMRGPSRNPGGDGIPPALWTTTAGCETGTRPIRSIRTSCGAAATPASSSASTAARG